MAKVSSNRKMFHDGHEVELPVLPLRGVVVFPGETTSLFVARTASVLAIDQALDSQEARWKVPKWVFLAAQRDPKQSDPTVDDLNLNGTVARVLQVLRLPDSTLKVRVEGVYRGRMAQGIQQDPFIKSLITVHYSRINIQAVASEEKVRMVLREYIRVNKDVSYKFLDEFDKIEDSSRAADRIAEVAGWNFRVKQDLLDTFDVHTRFCKIMDFMGAEIEKLKVRLKQPATTNSLPNQGSSYTGLSSARSEGLSQEELLFSLGALTSSVRLIDNGKPDEARRAIVDLLSMLAERCPDNIRELIEGLNKECP